MSARIRGRFGSVLFLAWLALWPAVGDESARYPCVVCDRAFEAGKVWYFEPKDGRPRLYVCGECKQLETRCSLCGLPTPADSLRTQDGRLICRREAKDVVLDEAEARRMFAELRAELQHLSGGVLVLRHPQVSVSLFDVDYWNQVGGKPVEAALRRKGFSTSRAVGRDLAHTVILLSGVRRAELAGICAHEFMHLWINENTTPERGLDFHTKEAVCELAAYVALEKRGETAQLQEILANPYTAGRIETAVKFFQVHGLVAVLDWVKTGQGATFNAEEFSRPAVATPANPLWQAGPAVPKTLPAELRLKGVLGTAARRLALINDKTFAVGEERLMPLQDRRVRVKVLAIRDQGVTVQLDDQPAPVELPLN